MNDYSKSKELAAGPDRENRNYTEYVETENPVIASSFHARLLNAFEQSVIATDLNGTVVFWNRFAEQLYGWSVKEALGRSLMELTIPEPNIPQAHEIMSHVRQDKSWTGELIVKGKNGAAFPARVANMPVYDEKGALIGSVSLSNDIRGPGDQGRSLHDSENKYRALVEQASDGIHTYDFQGNFLEVNSKLCEMLGYSREELLRLNVKDLIPPDDLRNNPVRFDELRDGKTLIRERRLLRKDGTIIMVEISGKVLREGELQAIIRDITERHEAEEKLKQSEERLRAIFEASRDGILVEDNEQIVFVNKSYSRLFGYDAPEELIGQNVSAVISSEDAERVLEFGRRRRLQGKQPSTRYEFKGKRKDGSLIDVEASVSTSNASDHTYITTMVRDISDRKRAEAALRESEEKYRGLFNSIDEGFCIIQMEFDATGRPLDYRFLEINPSFERMTGLEDAIGKTARQLVPDLEEFWFETYGRVALTGQAVRFENHAEQMNRWFDVYAARLGEEGSRRVAIIFTDITKRKQTEAALQSYVDRLRLITDAVPLLISYIDKEHCYRFVNRSYTEWFGKPREEVVGKHLSEVLGPAAYRGLLPKIESVLSGKEVTFELLANYKNGERFIYAYYVPDVAASTGQVVGFHAFVQDISERKQAERALIRSHEELEAHVRERTAELGRANNRLQLEMIQRREAEDARVQALHQLVTAQEDERRRIARDLHDQLGQQMTVLRQNLAILKNMCGGQAELSDQVAETQKIIRQLDSEIDFLARQIRPTVLDDLGIVAALDQYVRQWSEHFNIPAEFYANRSGKTPLAPEAETHLYRIAQEALNNIYKHARAGNVNISLEPRDGHAMLIIEDDGTGFDPEDQFPDREKNSGMGLLGMRERALLVGGKFEIESSKESGTTVYVSVPILNLPEKGEK